MRSGYVARKTWAAIAAGTAAAVGAACGLLADGGTEQTTAPNALVLAMGREPHTPVQKSVSLQRVGAGTSSEPMPRADLASTDDASAAHDLVDANLRCQIDRDAPSSDHIKLTPDPQLCDDFEKKPLSEAEIHQAITQAAEQGNVRAQLYYAGYVADLFQNPRYALDPRFADEFKINTVKFLESAGHAGESDAYLRLSDMYREETIVESNPSLSYAYATGFFQTSRSRYAEKRLQQSKAGLSQEELRQGETMAQEIIKQRNIQ